MDASDSNRHSWHVGRTNPGSGDGDPFAVPGVYPGTDGGGPDDASFAQEVDGELWMRRAVDETTWQIGGSGEVAWIAANTRPGRTIAAAIPAVFGAYATVIVPGNDEDKRVSDEALLALLPALAPQQPWWLGYLETGVADLVFPNAPRVRLYSGGPTSWSRRGPIRRPPGERTTMRRRGTVRYPS